ncbi:MAG TPA: calcium-binding protein [Pirellulaceae bacterium]|nr:calcium-binding protein [Pirellulaceae bacterium]
MSILPASRRRRSSAATSSVRRPSLFARHALERLESRIVLDGSNSDLILPPEDPTPFFESSDVGFPLGYSSSDTITLSANFVTPNDEDVLTVEWFLYADSDQNFNFDAEDGLILENELSLLDQSDFSGSTASDQYTSTLTINAGSIYAADPNADGVSPWNFHLLVKFTDNDGETAYYTQLIQVAPAAGSITAAIDSSFPAPLTEGSAPVTVAGSTTLTGGIYFDYQWEIYVNGSATPDAALTVAGSSYDADGNGSEAVPSYSFSPANEGIYRVKLTVTQGANSAIAEQYIVATNVAPTVDSLTGNSSGVAGQPLSFAASISDPGLNDAITGTWEVFDSSNALVASGTTSGRNVNFSYTPTNIGNFTLKFVANDGVADSASSSVAFSVSGSVKVGSVLNIGAVPGGSSVIVNSAAGGLSVTVDGNTVPFSGITAINIFGQQGNDTILIGGNITVPITIQAGNGNDIILIGSGVTSTVFAFGGAGNDIIVGGSGNNVLVGGAGDDLLTGGNRSDLLIGGTGSDILLGNAQDDILIASGTNLDTQQAALASVLAAWLNTSNSLATRRANVSAQLGTVTDDNASDLLLGLGGNDWFFANLSGSGARDLLLDASLAERLAHVEL